MSIKITLRMLSSKCSFDSAPLLLCEDRVCVRASTLAAAICSRLLVSKHVALALGMGRLGGMAGGTSAALLEEASP